MQGRADQLRDLLSGLASGDPTRRREARDIAQALRGSGATFGFPELSDVAALVEAARDEDLLRRVEGLITHLTELSRDPDERLGRGPPDLLPEWLTRVAGLDGPLAVAGEGGWGPVARKASLDLSELTRRAAEYLGVQAADFSTRRASALRLVPEAFVVAAGIVPLTEDAETITVASADPTRLTDEQELELLSGRRPLFVLAPPEVIEAVLDEIYGRHAATPPEVAGEDEPVEAEQDRPGANDRTDSSAEGAVLVVDDEPSARLLVRTFLERRGYVVIEAVDGVAALEALGDGRGVGLVVADLNMPRMDGLELIWELREAHPSLRLPVIVVTGEADEILETQLMEEGADDYIRKPIDPRLFLARVESTVRRVGARVTRTPGAGAAG